VFQFSPAQSPITTGEGGMITTNDDALEDKVRRLRDHGAAMPDLQRHWVPARTCWRATQTQVITNA